MFDRHDPRIALLLGQLKTRHEEIKRQEALASEELASFEALLAELGYISRGKKIEKAPVPEVTDEIRARIRTHGNKHLNNEGLMLLEQCFAAGMTNAQAARLLGTTPNPLKTKREKWERGEPLF